ncbi:hypothetical protein [Psychromonas aquimarina]|uniref:hypothetical protein n=1 Tax=Psychromonas aquimarina TaxID=444919 RepID=UPI00048C5204|nr:hypothetical protein [Psychromonas aquimarina]
MSNYLKIPVQLKNKELIQFLNSILVKNRIVDTVITDVTFLEDSMVMSFSKVNGKEPTNNEKIIIREVLSNSGIVFEFNR